jgi:hypothetical protein
MKNVLLPLLFTVFLFGCAPENVNNEYGCMVNPLAVNYNPDVRNDDGSCVMVYDVQNSLFVKFTATWCAPCGSWGGPAFVSTYTQNKGKVCAMALQTNDALSTPLNSSLVLGSTGFDSKWNYSGTPSFAVNDVNLDQAVGSVTGYVDAAHQLSPDMAVGIGKTIGAGDNEGMFNLNIYAKSYKNLTGQYNIAVYFLAKELVKNQNTDAGYNPNYVHHHVLLGAATGNGAWGDPIATDPKEGEVFHWSKAVDYTEYEQTYNTTRENIEVVAVIWKTDGSEYFFVNCTTN